ncbi:MAG: TSUP family transporter [Acidobacteria bacterium]|nr:TSUP family transporter [Acidobacteriota bacterium]
MNYLVVTAAALLAAVISLFSGFGLGTILMPVLALFFPVEAAIAATAAVHLANNLFKGMLFGKFARFPVVIRFAVPAGLLAIVGAWALQTLAGSPPLLEYRIAGLLFAPTPIGLLVGAVILTFALFELLPGLDRLTFDPRFLSIGGALSGFFGGLSGHQGAVRTAFLSRAGLGKEAFIGTMILCAIVVDVVRLLVYGAHGFGGKGFFSGRFTDSGLIPAAVFAAFLGSWIGTRLVRKVTLGGLHRLIGILLILFALALASGWI